MPRLIPAIVLAAIGIALVLFGAYKTFFIVAASTGAGIGLGFFGVVLTVVPLVLCWGIVFAAQRWVRNGRKSIQE